MPDTNYDTIKNVWTDELENDHLQDLEDLRLSKMIDYISSMRLKLAETNAEDRIQFSLLTQEVLNLEFMIHDLLVLRRDKIIRASFLQRRPMGTMTLVEEEFYNRLLRGFEGHKLYIDEVLAGNPSPTMTVESHASDESTDTKTIDKESNDMEYVLVRFLKPIESAFLGLDDVTYGPYEAENIATIPIANARTWLRDGTVTRVMVEDDSDE